MSNLVGSRLREMAELSQVRKQQIVQISSLITLLVVVIYSGLIFTHQQWLYLGLNLVCVMTLAGSLLYCTSRAQQYAHLVLSAVLLAQACALLYLGDTHPNRLFWLYPIVAIIIFINRFPVGLILSSALCGFGTVIVYRHHTDVAGGAIGDERLIISLLALSVICNACAYLYAQAVQCIQSLYQEGIEDLAYTDRLTGLANRWSFELWAKRKLEQQHGTETLTALVFIDIDNFKAINDNYGHQVGDQVLKRFAQRLKNNVRHRDRVTEHDDYSIARFAGDEFVLLLYDVRSGQDLDHILERICHLFHDRIQEQNPVMFNLLTVSAGAALFPRDADNLEELTRCADKAMYSAKYQGKNQYCYYHALAGQPPLPTEDTDSKVTPLRTVSQTYT